MQCPRPHLCAKDRQKNLIRWMEYADYVGCDVGKMDPYVVLLVQEAYMQGMNDLPCLDFLSKNIEIAEQSELFYGLSRNTLSLTDPFREITENVVIAEGKLLTVTEIRTEAEHFKRSINAMFKHISKPYLDTKRKLTDEILEKSDQRNLPTSSKCNCGMQPLIDTLPILQGVEEPLNPVIRHVINDALQLRFRATSAGKLVAAREGRLEVSFNTLKDWKLQSKEIMTAYEKLIQTPSGYIEIARDEVLNTQGGPEGPDQNLDVGFKLFDSFWGNIGTMFPNLGGATFPNQTGCDSQHFVAPGAENVNTSLEGPSPPIERFDLARWGLEHFEAQVVENINVNLFGSSTPNSRFPNLTNWDSKNLVAPGAGTVNSFLGGPITPKARFPTHAGWDLGHLAAPGAKSVNSNSTSASAQNMNQPDFSPYMSFDNPNFVADQSDDSSSDRPMVVQKSNGHYAVRKRSAVIKNFQTRNNYVQQETNGTHPVSDARSEQETATQPNTLDEDEYIAAKNRLRERFWNRDAEDMIKLRQRGLPIYTLEQFYHYEQKEKEYNDLCATFRKEKEERDKLLESYKREKAEKEERLNAERRNAERPNAEGPNAERPNAERPNAERPKPKVLVPQVSPPTRRTVKKKKRH